MNIIRNFYVDFIKITDKKLAFINYNTFDNFNLNQYENFIYVKIILINQDFSDYNLIQTPSINLENYFLKSPISLFEHNGYTLFTSTAMLKDENYNSENNINYFSILMIFGYPNGTDSTIDISYFIFDNVDNNIDQILSNDFYTFLFHNYTIENNIGYEADNRINLITIPDEIMIMENIMDEINGNSETKKTNNSFMSQEYIYILKQNIDLIKSSQYYYIDYQYMNKIPNDPIPYFGRTNRLKFKLCHKYCETCNELSTSDNEQKCLSCLPEYQYDYLYFQKINNNELLNCVPENHYLDGNNIIPCDIENTKYYINITNNNKKICFSIDNDCPSLYPIYNEITKECFNCDIERFKNGECTADDLTMESCTKCDYECFKTGGCNFNNFNTTNDDFYERIINGGFISNSNGDSSLKVNNGDGYAFQIIEVEKELMNLKEKNQRDFSIIDLKDCIDLLRDKNNLKPDEELILVKYENDNQVSNGNEKSIQYEVYLRNNTKLDLSVCSDTEISIYVPIELDEKTQKLYESLKEQRYNLFDINDKFYHDICTLYKSIDGTDVCLLDRKNIYEQNKLQCQENCEYSEYLPETKYLKCDCNITNEEKIDTKDPKKITGKKILKSFFDVAKYSNYKVLRCYNLVFRKVTIKENVGSILSNIYFIGYLIALYIFCYNKAEYLKKEIDKLLETEENINENITIKLNKDNISIDKDNIEKDKSEQKIKDKDEINIYDIKNLKNENEKNNDVDIIKINKKKNERNNRLKNTIKKIDIGYKSYSKYFNYFMNGVKNEKSKKKIKNKIINNKDNLSEHKNLSNKENTERKLNILEEKQNNDILKNISEKESKKSENENKIEKKEVKDLTDYELNELEYDEALELDNRNFLNIYWYLLKREHIILFTFINNNDYNLFSTKLSKLFLSICSDMAFNVFFFSDESMHNIYVSGGDHGWIDQFAQMVYATFISQILQIFINYLTMTDIHYYQLKELKKENKLNSQNVLSIKKCIKYKIIVYFCSTFILFLFFWYTSSAFCAVLLCFFLILYYLI